MMLPILVIKSISIIIINKILQTEKIFKLLEKQIFLLYKNNFFFPKNDTD